MTEPTVTISLSEFDRMRDEIKLQKSKLEEITRALDWAYKTTPDKLIKQKTDYEYGRAVSAVKFGEPI
jgi:hypothetical protein